MPDKPSFATSDPSAEWRRRTSCGFLGTQVDGPSAPIWVVLLTAPKDQAEGLARALVDRRLAACVNVVPGVRSFYRWEGQPEEAEESLLVVKTTEAGYPALEAGVRSLHPHQVPEVIGLPVSAAFAPYAAWVASNVGGPA